MNDSREEREPGEGAVNPQGRSSYSFSTRSQAISMAQEGVEGIEGARVMWRGELERRGYE